MQQKLSQLQSRQESLLRKIKVIRKISSIIQFSVSNMNSNILENLDNKIKQELNKFQVILPELFQQFTNLFRQFDKFFDCLNGFKQISLTNKKIMQKINSQLLKQTNINKMMKSEVLELNCLISEHYQMSKKKLIQKDQIIQNLKQKYEYFQNLRRPYSAEQNSKIDQLFFEQNIHTQQVFQEFNSKQFLSKSNKSIQVRKSNLDIIRQQQESNHSNPNSSRQKENDQNQQKPPQLQEENNNSQLNNLISKSLKTSKILNQKKTKTRYFIEGFRKIIQQPQLILKTQQFNQQDDAQLMSQSSTESNLSIGKTDIINDIIPLKNQSPRFLSESMFVEKLEVFDQSRKILQQSSPHSAKLKNKIFPKHNQNSQIIQKTKHERLKQKKKKNSQYLKENQIKKISSYKIKTLEQNQKNSIWKSNPRQKIALTSKSFTQNSQKSRQNTKQKVIHDLHNPSRFIQKKISNILNNLNISSIIDKKQQKYYQGTHKNGLKQGKGRLQYINGLLYQGQFKKNLQHGYGILSFNNNIIYQGQWQNGKFSGKGSLKNIHIMDKKVDNNYSDIIYSGNFLQNKFDGVGTLFVSQIQKFCCRFVNGKAEGQFSFYTQALQLFRKQGSVEFGVWNQSTF